jgi:hypothetical protein
MQRATDGRLHCKHNGLTRAVAGPLTARKRSIGTSTLVPVKDEPALTCLNSVRRAR